MSHHKKPRHGSDSHTNTRESALPERVPKKHFFKELAPMALSKQSFLNVESRGKIESNDPHHGYQCLHASIAVSVLHT